MDSKTLRAVMLTVAVGLLIASGILIYSALIVHTYSASLVCSSTGAATGAGGLAFLAAWLAVGAARRGRH